MYICLSLCTPHVFRCLWKPKDLLKKEWKAVVSFMMWVLGTELRSSGKVAKYSSTEPSLQSLLATFHFYFISRPHFNAH